MCGFPMRRQLLWYSTYCHRVSKSDESFDVVPIRSRPAYLIQRAHLRMHVQLPAPHPHLRLRLHLQLHLQLQLHLHSHLGLPACPPTSPVASTPRQPCTASPSTLVWNIAYFQILICRRPLLLRPGTAMLVLAGGGTPSFFLSRPSPPPLQPGTSRCVSSAICNLHSASCHAVPCRAMPCHAAPIYSTVCSPRTSTHSSVHRPRTLRCPRPILSHPGRAWLQPLFPVKTPHLAVPDCSSSQKPIQPSTRPRSHTPTRLPLARISAGLIPNRARQEELSFSRPRPRPRLASYFIGRPFSHPHACPPHPVQPLLLR